MMNLRKEEMGTRDLGPKGWEAIVGGATVESVAASVVSRSLLPDWYKDIERNVKKGMRCLELGSGTGAMSAALAKYVKADVTLLDYSVDNLDFSREVFSALGIEGRFYLHDVLRKLPFDDDYFDVVWSSGLLEHFDEYEIVDILRESKRVTKHKVLSLVPNANSVPYRLGKYLQERNGTWKWGKEEPRFSMAPLFIRARLKVRFEETVAPHHAIRFLRNAGQVEIANELATWYDGLPVKELAALRQGYLLLTIGGKR